MKVRSLLLIVAAMLLGSQPGAAQDTATVAKPAVWSLQNCIEYAKQQNITIKRNKVSAQTAAVNVAQAKAAREPSLSFSTNQGFTNRPFQQSSAMVNGSQVVTSNNKNSYSGNYGFNAQMTLYDGGQTSNNIKLQKINSQIADLAVTTSEMTIEEQITKLYVQILYSMETIKQDEEQIKLSSASAERARALFKEGVLNKADVAQLEAQCANDKYQLVADQSTLDNYKLQLKQLLELDGDEELNIVVPNLDGDVMAVLPSKRDVYNAALNLRPEIKANKLSMDASDLSIKMAKAGKLPTLSLTAGMTTLNMSNNGNFFDQLKRQWNNTIGLSLNIPILDRRSTKSAVEKAKLEKQNSYLQLLDTQKNLWKSIEGYWQEATSAQASYKAAKEQAEAVRTSYDLTSEQFRLGMKNIIELLTDQKNLSAANQKVIQTKYMEVLNASLLKYYGGDSINL